MTENEINKMNEEVEEEFFDYEEVPSSKEERRIKVSKRRKTEAFKKKAHVETCKQIVANLSKRENDGFFPTTKKNGKIVRKKFKKTTSRYTKEAEKMGII